MKAEENGNIGLIDNLRFLLLLGVILIHCNISYEAPESAGSGAWVVNFISHTLCSVCVPFYFLISAFLFFRGMDKFDGRWYAGKIRRRFHSLLVPYLLWNFIGLATIILKQHLSGGSNFAQYDNIDFTLSNIIKGFWSMSAIDSSLLPYPYDFVLWFVRDLIVLTLLTPVFYLLARHAGKLILILLFILTTFRTGIPLPMTEIFFFYVGAYMAIRHVKFDVLPKRGKWFALPCMLLALLPEIITYPATVNSTFLYILTAIPAVSFAVALLIRKIGAIPPKVVAACFFIYAFHGLYVTMASKLSMSVIPPDTPLACVGCYLFDFVFITAFATAAYMIARRIMPRFTNLLSGGR